MQGITVLLLAGHRPNPGPICEAYKVVTKSQVRIAGRPMILHPLASLVANKRTTRIIVISQQPELISEMLAEYPAIAELEYYRGEGGIARSVINCIRDCDIQMPLLVTTADNCLLRDEDIDDFLDQAESCRAELAIGVAHKDVLTGLYPDVRRSWIPFSDTSISGCNLFWFNGSACLELVEFWGRYESSPKKLFRLAWSFGPVFYWRYLCGQLSLSDAFVRISAMTGVRVIPVPLKNAAVSIDADKITDIIQIEAVLNRQSVDVPVAHTTSASDAPVVIFDLDRTITRHGTYTPFLIRYALKQQPARLLWAPLIILYMLAYLAGRIDRKVLKTRMFHLLAGSPDRDSLERACIEYVDTAIDHDVHADALYTIRMWREQGARLILATASYDWLANVFAQRLGFDQVVATRSISRDGRVVPGVDGENCYGEAKLGMVKAAIGLPRQKLSGVWFYTDHHSDIPLLEICDHPVAVNPTRKLEAWIRQRRGGISVNWHAGSHHRSGKPVLAPVTSLCLALMLFAGLLEAGEEEINLDQVPPVVLSAVNLEQPEMHITEASKESQGTSIVYELEGTLAGNEYEYEIEVSAEGRILSVREEVEIYSLLKRFIGWS